MEQAFKDALRAIYDVGVEEEGDDMDAISNKLGACNRLARDTLHELFGEVV